MGRRERCASFYELQTEDLPPLHRLIALEHPAGADPRRCWLQAVLRAHQLLQRMPTAQELRPVSRRAARKLLRAVEGQRQRPQTARLQAGTQANPVEARGSQRGRGRRKGATA